MLMELFKRKQQAQQQQQPSHAELYRQRMQPGANQQNLGPQEHQAFAREWTRDNPWLAVPSLTAAIPMYSGAKALGLTKARSPASLDEMASGYRGMWEGLWGS